MYRSNRPNHGLWVLSTNTTLPAEDVARKYKQLLLVIVEGLENLGEAEISTGGKRYMMRTEANKAVIRSFSAIGMALPPAIRTIK